MTKQEKIIKEELQEAQYIGEDGGMVVAVDTLDEAYEKMEQRIIEDCGLKDWEAMELKKDDIGIGWLHLTISKNKDKMEGCEWYISIDKESPYAVFVYWG